MIKNLKKCLALLLSVVMVLAMSVSVFATTVEPNNNQTGSRTVLSVDPTITTGSLTIGNQTEGATYTAYPVFTATVKPNDGTYTWTPVDEFKTALANKTAEQIATLAASDLKNLATALANSGTKPSPATDLEELPLGYYLVVESGAAGLEASQPILVAIPQVQTIEGTEQWVYDITVVPKSSTTDFSKKIAEGTELVDTNTKNVGDYVDYRLWADIPEYADHCYEEKDSANLQFKISDKMSSQLTWGTSSNISVYVINQYDEATVAGITSTEAIANKDNVNYTIDPAPVVGTAGEDFTVNFTKKFLKDNKGKVVVVAFSAQLNKNAIIATGEGENIEGYTTGLKENDPDYNGKGNPNAAKLTYTNEYDADKDSTTEDIKDTVTTFTFELKTEKVDADEITKMLGGAEFTIYTDEACTKAYKNDDDLFKNPLVTSVDTENGKVIGQATGLGFKDATYYLKETKAPVGYQLYDGVIKVELKATTAQDNTEIYTGQYTYTYELGSLSKDENDKIVWVKTANTETVEGEDIVTVKDKKGTTLPGTGGIGTTIFTFGGLALVILAAAMFIVYMKKQKRQA